VSRCIDVIDATSRTVWSWHVQRVWRDVVHQLQRRLRVSSWLDYAIPCFSCVSSWDFQRVWRDVVQQL
jgi:hypothetical protein